MEGYDYNQNKELPYAAIPSFPLRWLLLWLEGKRRILGKKVLELQMDYHDICSHPILDEMVGATYLNIRIQQSHQALSGDGMRVVLVLL